MVRPFSDPYGGAIVERTASAKGTRSRVAGPSAGQGPARRTISAPNGPISSAPSVHKRARQSPLFCLILSQLAAGGEQLLVHPRDQNVPVKFAPNGEPGSSPAEAMAVNFRVQQRHVPPYNVTRVTSSLIGDILVLSQKPRQLLPHRRYVHPTLLAARGQNVGFVRGIRMQRPMGAGMSLSLRRLRGLVRCLVPFVWRQARIVRRLCLQVELSLRRCAFCARSAAFSGSKTARHASTPSSRSSNARISASFVMP